ncbi:type IV toxin-antitoxin system AbiEi family antitoxin domain-containing protein [Candidatus Nucleicultrix amoebiphila]|jgi:predicted transcriptional regulator of viral defense system|uniref:type IV toxin-antitoxin system AbiEi family antitoxin domain-containing protein n=1 Tax=Candidatus Nucleicultrix amoebiphila TaxID=1509244 RepID=UPI000A26E8DF|nr:type IV toxin-antitoxin system AbiEi family antitoxin domain-containing protein [Candidatus Nucleicultrix amoebiphila]
MSTISGLGKLDREQLSSILREAENVISVEQASEILGVSRHLAGKQLARWCSKGWLSRIKRGVYIPVPLESKVTDVSLEDPWIIAEKLYRPCYVGGWSAGEYWGLTEQIFRTLLIKTTQKPRNLHPVMNGTPFMLITTSPNAMFGLKPVWRGQIKVMVSDPTRTIIDFLVDPKIGGGIRTTTDMLKEYLQSEHKNLSLMIEYATQLANGAVFKRLGFLLEMCVPEETATIEACSKHLTKGKSKLDPQLSADKLITKWRLWIPANWKY